MFNSNVLVDIGEAIGNIGKRVFPRRSHVEALDEAVRRYLQDPIPLCLPDKAGEANGSREADIEGSYRVLDEEEK